MWETNSARSRSYWGFYTSLLHLLFNCRPIPCYHVCNLFSTWHTGSLFYHEGGASVCILKIFHHAIWQISPLFKLIVHRCNIIFYSKHIVWAKNGLKLRLSAYIGPFQPMWQWSMKGLPGWHLKGPTLTSSVSLGSEGTCTISPVTYISQAIVRNVVNIFRIILKLSPSHCNRAANQKLVETGRNW